MRNIIFGWVLGTFHTCGFPEITKHITAEVEALFEENNITTREEKLNWLGGDKLADMVREYHNKSIWNVWNL